VNEVRSKRRRVVPVPAGVTPRQYKTTLSSPGLTG
jgi:hypothetical protein